MTVSCILNMITMLRVGVVMTTIIIISIKCLTRAVKSLYKTVHQSIHTASVKMSPHHVSLPGGGFVFKAKLSLEISAETEVEKLDVEYDTILSIKHNRRNKGMEIINITNGKGDQTPQHFPLIIMWGSRTSKSKEDILVYTGEIDIDNDHSVMFLVAEVNERCNRDDTIDTIGQRGIVKWLEVCDMVILQDDNNFPRKLFRDLSRAAEGMVTLVTGPSVKDIVNSPSMLALAKTIVDQFNLVSFSMCCNLFMLFKYDVMKLVTSIDQDCCLFVTVLTMCSYKWMIYNNVEWKLLGTCSTYQVFWPVLACHNYL